MEKAPKTTYLDTTVSTCAWITYGECHVLLLLQCIPDTLKILCLQHARQTTLSVLLITRAILNNISV